MSIRIWRPLVEDKAHGYNNREEKVGHDIERRMRVGKAFDRAWAPACSFDVVVPHDAHVGALKDEADHAANRVDEHEDYRHQQESRLHSQYLPYR